jgi:hypothetical protein
LTNNEKAILKRFLSDDTKIQGLSMLVFRAKKVRKTLSEDLTLIDSVLEKIEVSNSGA